MVMVQVCINSKKPPEDVRYNCPEILRKWLIHVFREVKGVVNVLFSPRKDICDVISSGESGWLFIFRGILPEKFESWAGGHFWAGFNGARRSKRTPNASE
jgi:hypothetical protein